MRQHYLIVGQGLAGSLLAQTLIEHEQEITVVDDAVPHSASRVAAGIINPLAGQRMVVGPEIPQCLPFALKYYERLAAQFNQAFYYASPMLRMFSDSREKDRFHARCNDKRYQDYLGEEFAAGESGEDINDAFGGFNQQQTGFLEIKSLLEHLQNSFRQQSLYINAHFNYAALQAGKDFVEWNGRRFDHVIFCEGASAVNNPWFRWLPFQLSKGELITVAVDQVLPRKMINRGYWVLPVSDHEAKAGASYSWDWIDNAPSTTARDELLAFCSNTFSNVKNVKITDHQAAIRPTTRDKLPFIGTHPRYARLHCFNGFGSKGGMLIPFYAEAMANNLVKDEPLPAQVNIHRFLNSNSLVVLARQYLSEHIFPGDIVIDATVGNGHDTELLARCVGNNGHVFGFDIQQSALTNTQRRITRESLGNRVTLFKIDHANMTANFKKDMHGKVSAVVFNLGFLPGADKNCTTQADTTLEALQHAVELIKREGSIVVMTYSGHECGKKETQIVKQWVAELDKLRFECRTIDAFGKADAPTLIIITKIKN